MSDESEGRSPLPIHLQHAAALARYVSAVQRGEIAWHGEDSVDSHVTAVQVLAQYIASQGEAGREPSCDRAQMELLEMVGKALVHDGMYRLTHFDQSSPDPAEAHRRLISGKQLLAFLKTLSRPAAK